MRGRIALAAVMAALSVVPLSASGVSASPGARATGCQATFSVQVVGGGSWTLDPKGTWLDGNGAFCQVPQTIGVTAADISMSGVDDTTAGETTWNLANTQTAATVSFDNYDPGFSAYCAVVGGSGYTCSVLNREVTFRPSTSDAVAPRVSAELLSRVPVEHVVARSRLGVLVRTSEPGSIRVSLVRGSGWRVARGGPGDGAGRGRAGVRAGASDGRRAQGAVTGTRVRALSPGPSGGRSGRQRPEKACARALVGGERDLDGPLPQAA